MRTALYDRHVALRAKMVDFSGWEMPLQYTSIIQEHHTVRNAVGIFDVSHMGRVLVSGREAADLLDFLSTNDISNKAVGTATYTAWSADDGFCVDDLIVYRTDEEAFFVVFNAGNRQKDLDHLQHYAKKYDVNVVSGYNEDGILAIQGPQAISLAKRLFPEIISLKPMHLTNVSHEGQDIIVSRTGYTGSGGVEIYAPNTLIGGLWDLFLEEGKAEGIQPIGLGARDTLRLEMGYALYGHELSPAIMPSESVAAWTVKWDKEIFLGKRALEDRRSADLDRKPYGIILQDKGIAREGYEVFSEGSLIGKVTSGTMSPSLNQAIALILVKKTLSPGDIVDVAIRQNLCKAKVVPLPFLNKVTRPSHPE